MILLQMKDEWILLLVTEEDVTKKPKEGEEMDLAIFESEGSRTFTSIFFLGKCKTLS
jgi:hypothetical protein